MEQSVMDWTPQSSDLNIIEAAWNHPDREQDKRQSISKEELWKSFKKPGELFLKPERKIQESLPKSVQAE